MKFKDVFNGIEKAEVFGFVVVLVCCNIGLITRGGPREIGAAVTRARGHLAHPHPRPRLLRHQDSDLSAAPLAMPTSSSRNPFTAEEIPAVDVAVEHLVKNYGSLKVLKRHQLQGRARAKSSS